MWPVKLYQPNFRKINYECWDEDRAEESANVGNIIEINWNLHQARNILFVNDEASMYFCTTVMRKNHTWLGIGFADCGTRIKINPFNGNLKIYPLHNNLTFLKENLILIAIVSRKWSKMSVVETCTILAKSTDASVCHCKRNWKAITRCVLVSYCCY